MRASSPDAGIADTENVFRQGLSLAGRALAETRPLLRHLLRNDASPLLNDEVVARVRGLLADLARRLASSMPEAAWSDHAQHTAFAEDLFALMIEAPALLSHAHAMALEWQLAEQMEARLALDPILPPLLQAWLSSDDTVIAETASALLAAQARFGQGMRRMKLPVSELPADLFRLSLQMLRALAEEHDGLAAYASAAEAALRDEYEERRTRLGLIERVIIALRGDAAQALALEHGGVAMFLTALAIGSGQTRTATTLAVADSQLLPLALALTACGLPGAVVAAQVLAIHPEGTLPRGLETLDPDQAADLLAANAAGEGGA